MPRGFFVVVEGPDGSGKSTLVAALADRLAREFPGELVATREPGGAGVPLAEEIRETLLRHGSDLSPRAESLLFCAARAQHVEQLIAPALARGKLVLCDRFAWSSIAYQGAARGLGESAVAAVSAFAANGLRADLTVLLTVDYATASERIASKRARLADRLDDLGARAFADVNASYARLAGSEGSVLVLDGARDAGQLAEEAALAIAKGYRGRR